MSDTAAALRAAKEVQADTLAPELFRQASEAFFKAKKEYKFKNFQQARNWAEQARHFAERAEFDALRNGGARTDTPPDPYANMEAPPAPGQTQSGGGKPKPYEYPTPVGTPADVYDQRKAADDAARKAAQQPPPASGALPNGQQAPGAAPTPAQLPTPVTAP